MSADKSPWAGRSFAALVEDKNVVGLLDDIQSVVEARNLPPRELIAVLTMALCGAMSGLCKCTEHDHRAEAQGWVNEITKLYPLKWEPGEAKENATE